MAETSGRLIELCFGFEFPAEAWTYNHAGGYLALTEEAEIALGEIGAALERAIQKGGPREPMRRVGAIYREWTTRFPGPEGDLVLPPEALDDEAVEAE